MCGQQFQEQPMSPYPISPQLLANLAQRQLLPYRQSKFPGLEAMDPRYIQPLAGWDQRPANTWDEEQYNAILRRLFTGGGNYGR